MKAADPVVPWSTAMTYIRWCLCRAMTIADRGIRVEEDLVLDDDVTAAEESDPGFQGYS